MYTHFDTLENNIGEHLCVVVYVRVCIHKNEMKIT